MLRFGPGGKQPESYIVVTLLRKICLTIFNKSSFGSEVGYNRHFENRCILSYTSMYIPYTHMYILYLYL